MTVVSFRSDNTPDTLFKGSDAVIIVTDHTEFNNLDYNSLIKMMRKKLIVDTRDILGKYTNKDLLYFKI